MIGLQKGGGQPLAKSGPSPTGVRYPPLPREHGVGDALGDRAEGYMLLLKCLTTATFGIDNAF